MNILDLQALEQLFHLCERCFSIYASSLSED